MKARKWILAASAIGVALAMPNLVRPGPRAASGAEPEPDARAVRIEHEFITLADTPTSAARTDRVMPARLSATPGSRRPVTPPRTFAQKARRALLGDGRHRPEPFPAARQP